MIRILKRVSAADGSGKEYIEAAALSTDSKPTDGIITGSVIDEVDTGKRFEFDETVEDWIEQPAKGGGGGLPPVTAADNGKVATVMNGEWGAGEAPYTVEESTETTVIYAENTVTLKNGGQANIGDFASVPTVGDTLTVVWNGDTYECEAEAYQEGGQTVATKCGAVGILSGEPDWSVYPFCLILPLEISGGGAVIAENNGSATLSVGKLVATKTVTPSDDFKSAVAASVSGLDAFVITFAWDDDLDGYVADKTYAECKAASDAGKTLMVHESSLGEKYGFAFANNYGVTGYRYSIAVGGSGRQLYVSEYKIGTNDAATVTNYYCDVTAQS